MRTVLVLGAGLVAGPAVRHLLDRGHRVVVADVDRSRADRLAGDDDRARAARIDLADGAGLADRISEVDAVISLVPFGFHPRVATACIAAGRPLVTASYVSPEMLRLDGAARDAGVTLLNEMGLDPGIDHMSAMRVIDRATAVGDAVVGFRSWCGGLPAPEASHDNPLRYKFSWSPHGVLAAATQSARYRLEGNVVEVPADRLFADVRAIDVPGIETLEGYPNRDSLGYADIYRIPRARTLLRGTLRYPGWCEHLLAWSRLGLLGSEPASTATGRALVLALAGADTDADPAAAMADRLGVEIDAAPIRTLDWLGMFAADPTGPEATAPIDALAARMADRLAYRPGEQDLVVLVHEIETETADGGRRSITARLVETGAPEGPTAMARTVGLPAAIGACRLMAGDVPPGVHRPTEPWIYDPALDALAEAGIEVTESIEESAPRDDA